MYFRFCTNQTIHSGQNLLNYAAETMQFEVNMTKKADNFFTVIVVTGDGSQLAVGPPVEHMHCNIHWWLFIVSNRFTNKFFNEKMIQLIMKYCCFKTRWQNLILNFQAVSMNQQHCLYLRNLTKIRCYRVIQQHVLTSLIS